MLHIVPGFYWVDTTFLSAVLWRIICQKKYKSNEIQQRGWGDDFQLALIQILSVNLQLASIPQKIQINLRHKSLDCTKLIYFKSLIKTVITCKTSYLLYCLCYRTIVRDFRQKLNNSVCWTSAFNQSESNLWVWGDPWFSECKNNEELRRSLSLEKSLKEISWYFLIVPSPVLCVSWLG